MINSIETSILCQWFVDNKFSIHLGEDTTKSILFTGRNKIKKIDLVIDLFGNK